jgi:hypothetical protein
MELALLALVFGVLTAGLAAVKGSQPPAPVRVRAAARRRSVRR